jgi:hypothetical protein
MGCDAPFPESKLCLEKHEFHRLVRRSWSLDRVFRCLNSFRLYPFASHFLPVIADCISFSQEKSDPGVVRRSMGRESGSPSLIEVGVCIRGRAPVRGAIEWVAEPGRGLGMLDRFFDAVGELGLGL